MSRSSSKQLALVDALSLVAPSPAPAPGSDAAPSSPKAAVKRCVAAWHRSIKAYRESDERVSVGILDAREGGAAYCNAMPMLAGYAGIRDFVACAAHGILIGAIPVEKSGQLLYAAQVALNILHSGSVQPKSLTK